MSAPIRSMKAARLYAIGAPFEVERVQINEPTGSDVLIRVHACGVVPNLKNVITYLPTWFPRLPMPALPAIYGLDPAGVVAAVGPDVHDIDIGQRVYVNPGRSCGSCVACRRDDPISCQSYTFVGYFGFGEGSRRVFERYPWGGFAEYMIAPASSLVDLPDNLSFEAAARFGYLGTAYAGLRKGSAGPSTSVLVNGATGTLGIGAVLLALAMGVPHIFAVARNHDLLDQVKQLAPGRIEAFSTDDGSTAGWVKAATNGRGADIVIEALGPGAPASQSLEALMALAPGGRFIGTGGMKDPLTLDPIYLMVNQLSYIGSNWFTTAEGKDMAQMAGAGTLDLSIFEHKRFPLEQVNEALDAAAGIHHGGFTNVVIDLT